MGFYSDEYDHDTYADMQDWPDDPGDDHDTEIDFEEVESADLDGFSEAELAVKGHVYIARFVCRSCGGQHTIGDMDNPKGWMKLYTGFTANEPQSSDSLAAVQPRMQAHRAGRGAKCTRTILRTQACRQCSGQLDIEPVTAFPGTRRDERTIKRSGHADRYAARRTGGSYKSARQIAKARLLAVRGGTWA